MREEACEALDDTVPVAQAVALWLAVCVPLAAGVGVELTELVAVGVLVQLTVPVVVLVREALPAAVAVTLALEVRLVVVVPHMLGAALPLGLALGLPVVVGLLLTVEDAVAVELEERVLLVDREGERVGVLVGDCERVAVRLPGPRLRLPLALMHALGLRVCVGVPVRVALAEVHSVEEGEVVRVRVEVGEGEPDAVLDPSTWEKRVATRIAHSPRAMAGLAAATQTVEEKKKKKSAGARTGSRPP